MPIWNGVKGGVYKFPSAPPMSTEKRIYETSNEYYERYDDEVGRLLMYPNQINTYEGAKKDRGAYRLNDNPTQERRWRTSPDLRLWPLSSHFVRWDHSPPRPLAMDPGISPSPSLFVPFLCF